MTLIDKAEALAIALSCPDSHWGPWVAKRLAALPARGVGVKPLVWEPSVIGKPWHSAKAPWGWYYAQWDDETQAWFASLEMGEVEAPIIMSPSDVPTIDAAKAAAQDDYEARILASVHHVNETPKSEHDGADVLTAPDMREAALSVLAGLSSYLGTGLGDDDTTAEQFDKRIRWAIDDLTARTRQAALREAAALCDGEERSGGTGWECRDAILALIGEERT